MFLTKILKYHTLKPWMTTQTKNVLDLSIKGASGCHYILKNNQKIVDFTSGLMVTNLGHNHSYLNYKMKYFIDQGLLFSPPSILIDEREKLSERLLNISGNKGGKVFYINGGADANESALYFANSYSTDKKRILRFEKSFHGGSSYIASYLGGDMRRDNKMEHFDLDLYKDIVLPNPKMSDGGVESLNKIEQLFQKEHKNISGILIEGSSGTGGIYTYPKNYLDSLGNLVKKYDILLIIDEVMSGFGRTGKFFGFQHSNVQPDMITMAKGLTNGNIPMGGVILSPKMIKQFEDNIVWNGLTYSGHPLSSATANACLDLYLNDDLKIIENCNYLGKILNTQLKILKEKYPDKILDVRGLGLLTCIEFKENYLGKVVSELPKKNIFAFSNENNLFISPPLVIKEELMIETLNKIENIIYRL